MSYFEAPVFRSAILERPQAPPTRWPPTTREGKEEDGNGNLRSSILLQKWSSTTMSVLENPTCCYGSHHHPAMIKSSDEILQQRWVWELEKVPSLPMFYPLQEWNTTKVDNLLLSTITSRISEFLRLQSIETSYNNDGGLVRCRTFSGVEFVINIWETSCDNRAISPTTTTYYYLIHTQHITGCSMEMQCLRSEIRTSVLNPTAATTDLSQSPYKQRNNYCIRRSRELPVYLETPGIELTMEGIIEHETPLEFCLSMLDSKLLSEKRLGLESLDALTDRSKSTTDAVQEACHAVITDSNIHEVLKEHLIPAASPDDYGEADDNNNTLFDSECRHDRRRNHILVLNILTRSLVEKRNTNNKRRLQPNINNNNNKFWESMVLNVVLDNIQNASTRPLEASLSARCLLELLDGLSSMMLPFTTTIIDFTNLQKHMVNAIEFGRMHNASLERDARRLLCHFEAVLAQ